MSSKATIEVTGPLDQVRAALLTLPDVTVKAPSPRAEVLEVGDQVVFLAYDDVDEVTMLLVGGVVPDREALVIFDQLREATALQLVVFASDSEVEIARRDVVANV